MNYLKFFTITIIGAGMASCGTYSTYSRPEVGVIDSLYTAEDTATIADLSWRELFADAYLQELIEIGLANNTDLSTARQRTVQAAATLQAARLAILPSVSLGAQGSVSSFDGAKATQTYTIGADASWEIDLAGNLRNERRGSAEAFFAAQAYERSVQTQLIASIADSYYSLIALDKKIEVTRLAVATREETLRAMEAMKRGGRCTEAAVAQTLASVASARATEVSLLQQRDELCNNLTALLGIAPREIKRSDLFDLSFDSELRTGAPAQLLSRRPDVQYAEHTLAQSFYDVNKARAAFYPRLTLSGSAGWTNNGGAGISNPGAWLLQAIGSLTQPLFNRGTNRANLLIARAQYRQALNAFVQALLDAGAEVNNALIQWQAARQRLAIDADQVEALESAAESTLKLMQHGNGSYIEVLSARESLLQARLEQVSDKYSEINSVISLYHALGGGCL
ncbi:MAG: efflux transporter outer membrane subunit [Muribaculaceae bacterium]